MVTRQDEFRAQCLFVGMNVVGRWVATLALTITITRLSMCVTGDKTPLLE